MRQLDIKINRAQITGFRASLNSEGLPDVTVDIMLMTEQGKEVTTHSLSTSAWRKEDKFALPLVMIDPIKRIHAALEEVVVRHMNDGQVMLGEGAAPEPYDFEKGDAVEEEIVEGEFDEDIEDEEDILARANDQEGFIDAQEDELEYPLDLIDPFGLEDEVKIPRITSLDDDDIGRYVLYVPSVGEPERGRLLTYDNASGLAWVVYKCDDDWENYEKYTAASTNYSDLAYE